MSDGDFVMLRQSVALVVGLAVLVAVPRAQERKFYSDDPLLVDNDRLDVPTEPAEIALSDMFDRFGHIMADLGDAARGEAQNANTLDEVPDSSWFTNRHGVQRMSRAALVRGPDTNEGPDMTVPWRVFRSKIGGLTPGFQIIDGRGDRYVIKFDPVGVPELSSAAEVIATKLFCAIGYNVPENFIVAVDPEAGLTIEPGTMLEDEFGDETALTRGQLRRRLRLVPRLDNGRMRVTASRYLSGRPIGPFRYYGTRTDDANDVVAHENRRELRGLRLFAAWTNHDDTRAQNTQDSWVEEDGRHYIRHHLLDFGSTFGSGSVDLQLPNLGFHYWLDTDEVKRNLVSFGLRTPKYRTVDWPSFPEYESVGRWESVSFEPQEWKNDYPNPAFVRMTDRDAFWAAKVIMRFTPEELLAIVETGQLSDPEQERYFHQVLVERQIKSARYYINRVNPIDEFEVGADGLRFVNLSERYGFAESGTAYDVEWSVYDNGTDGVRGLTDSATQSATTVRLPANPGLDGDAYLMAEIRSVHADFPAWNEPVRVYLRPNSATYDVIGIER
jgi:hypothetical protein|tara:strand:- start:7883 stop:9550 length:1668 start_codon:yes stop_codon:yes gene_type:complete